MKVETLITIEEELEAALGRASKLLEGDLDVVVVGYPYHDNPPGDWYAAIKVVCKNQEIAQKVQKGGYRQEKEHQQFPLCSTMLMTSFANRDVVRRQQEETKNFSEEMKDEISEKVLRVAELLTQIN